MRAQGRTTARADERQRLWATSLMGVAARPVLRIATIALVCVAGVASAAPEGIEGRWVSVRATQMLTLDISRCEAGWCGVRVDGGRCGRTVLRLGAGEPSDKPPSGTLQLTSDSFRYGVRASLRQDDGKSVMTIVGHTGAGDPFAAMRRTFDSAPSWCAWMRRPARRTTRCREGDTCDTTPTH